MSSRAKVRRLLTAVAIAAATIGQFGLSQAGCAFSVTPSADPAAPRTDVVLTASCLHDGTGNPLAGKTVSFTITRPDSTTASLSGTTDDLGNTTAAFLDTHQLGTYGVSATSGIANASSAFVVQAGAPTGSFQLTATNACVNAALPVITASALGIKDAPGDPISPRVILFTFTAPDATSSTPATTFTRTVTSSAPATDAGLSSASVVFDFKKPDDTVYAPEGAWTFRADAGAAAATGSFRVLASVPTANVTTISATTAPTAAVAPGKPAALTATVTDGTAAQPCADVTFSVTRPGGGVSSGTVQSDATGVARLSDVRTDEYGTYNVSVTSGTATAALAAFSVAPGGVARFSAAATPNVATTGTDIAIAADRVVDSAGNPVNATDSIHLWVDAPNADRVEADTAVTPANSRLGRASATATLAAADVDETGTWRLHTFLGDSTTGDPAADWNTDALGLLIVWYTYTTFEIVDSLPTSSGAVGGDLNVSAPNLSNTGLAQTITVSNVPADSDSVSISVTKPDNSAPFTASGTPSGGTATIPMPGTATGLEGVYEISATSSAASVQNALGSGTFLVHIDRQLTLASNRGAQCVQFPGNSLTITASLENLATNTAIANSPIRLVVENVAAVGTYDRTQQTTGGGTTAFTFGGMDPDTKTSTLVPGNYTATATATDFGISSVLNFCVTKALV